MKINRVIKKILIVVRVLKILISAFNSYLNNHGLSGELLICKPASSNRIKIDINPLTAEQPVWFISDGVHPNNDGVTLQK